MLRTDPTMAVLVIISLLAILNSILDGLFGGLEGFECWCRADNGAINADVASGAASSLQIPQAQTSQTTTTAVMTAQTKTLTGPFTAPNNTTVFTLAGGIQSWQVSATSFSTAANIKCTLTCLVDAQTFSTTHFFNPSGQHLTYPTLEFVTTLPAGQHTVVVSGSCSSDSNDTASILLKEYPSS